MGNVTHELPLEDVTITNRRILGHRRWREIARTNQPGTCLYCGRKLRKPRFHDGPCRGAYLDNAFCDLRCGYCFGVALAKAGKRLTPFDGTTVNED